VEVAVEVAAVVEVVVEEIGGGDLKVSSHFIAKRN